MVKSRKWTIALFLFYLIALSGIILFKNRLAFTFLQYRFTFVMDAERSINLVPFGAMLFLNDKPSYHEIFYNALVFVPLGMFICMLRAKKSFVQLVMPILLTSLFFEAAQYIFALGASDITDIIANTLGGILGIGIFFIFQKLCKENVDRVLNIIALIAEIVVALMISMMRPL